jgi:CBS domain-containing protein
MNAKNHRPARVAEGMRSSSVSVDENATPRDILAEMDRVGVDELPVTGEGGSFQGMVPRRVVERRLYDWGDDDVTASMFDEAAVARATPDEPIESAIDRMLAADLAVLPVVSSRGRLEGLVVLDDLRHVPDLVEAVGEGRRRRALIAESGSARVIMACSVVSVLLGVATFALWIEGPAYWLPAWVGWVDAVVALLAFVGAVAASTTEMLSVPLWAVAGIGLIFAAAVGHAWGDGAWTTWVQLALGLGFLAMAAVIGTAVPRRRHARISDRVGARRVTTSA